MATSVASATVQDFYSPKLIIEPVAPPDESLKERLDVPGWRVTKWGLFYFVRPEAGMLDSVNTTAAQFNVTGSNLGNIFPVVLDYGTTVYSLFTTVNFARAVLRRHVPTYRLVLSEMYAGRGLIGFVLDQIDPKCSFEEDDHGYCMKPAKYLADRNEFNLHYLCPEHRVARNHSFAKRRTGEK